MLYKSDLYLNLLFASLMGRLGLIGYHGCVKTKRFHPNDRWFQKGLFFLSRLSCLLHVIANVYSIWIQARKSSKPASAYSVVTAYISPPALVLILYVDKLIYRNCPIFSESLNIFYDTLPGGRRSRKTLLKIRLVDLVFIFAPCMVPCLAVPMVGLAYLADPCMPPSIWPFLSMWSQTQTMLLVSMAVDIIFMTFMLVCVYNIVLMGPVNVLFYDNLLGELHRKAITARSLKIGKRARAFIMEELVIDVRDICIRMHIYNDRTSQGMYLTKQLCLNVSVAGYFLFIHCLNRYPAISICGIVVALPCTIFYNVIFDKAFFFKDRMDAVLANYVLAATRFQFQSSRKYYKKIAKSVMFKGFMVGPQPLERQSTLNFVGFVIDQTVALVLGTDSM